VFEEPSVTDKIESYWDDKVMLDRGCWLMLCWQSRDAPYFPKVNRLISIEPRLLLSAIIPQPCYPASHSPFLLTSPLTHLHFYFTITLSLSSWKTYRLSHTSLCRQATYAYSSRVLSNSLTAGLGSCKPSALTLLALHTKPCRMYGVHKTKHIQSFAMGGHYAFIITSTQHFHT
jgi:hypothetical protein